MDEDEQLLLISFVAYWLILFLLIRNSKNRLRTSIINLVIHVSYSSYFLYDLFYANSGAWDWLLRIFFLFIFLWVHSLLNLLQLIYILLSKKQKPKQNERR